MTARRAAPVVLCIVLMSGTAAKAAAIPEGAAAREIVALRTAHTATFANPDGTFDTVAAPFPIHYFADGAYHRNQLRFREYQPGHFLADEMPYAVDVPGPRVEIGPRDRSGALVLHCGVFVLAAVAGAPIATPPLAGAQPFAYVVNSTDDTVSVIDTEALAVVATIPVEAGAWQLAVAADERYVYTTSLGAAEGVISVISTTERRVVKQIELFRSDPDDIVVSPCGRFLYVTRS